MVGAKRDDLRFSLDNRLAVVFHVTQKTLAIKDRGAWKKSKEFKKH